MKSIISECRRYLKFGVAAQVMAFLLSASAVLTATAAPSAACSPEVERVSVTVDGAAYRGRAILYEDTTYVELGEFARAFGDVSVSWNADTLTTSVCGDSVQMCVTDGKQWFVANERYLWCENGVFSSADGAYVPLRTAARALGAEVSWSEAEFAAHVTLASGPLSSGAEFYREDEVYWLSRIIYAEAGNEPFAGQIAVGNVVLNRVRSDAFPNTIYAVIFDTRYGVQFSPIANGAIYQTPDEEAVIAAKLCLEGYTLSEEILYFLNPALASNLWTAQNRPYVMTISGHDFYA